MKTLSSLRGCSRVRDARTLQARLRRMCLEEAGVTLDALYIFHIVDEDGDAAYCFTSAVLNPELRRIGFEAHDHSLCLKIRTPPGFAFNLKIGEKG